MQECYCFFIVVGQNVVVVFFNVCKFFDFVLGEYCIVVYQFDVVVYFFDFVDYVGVYEDCFVCFGELDDFFNKFYFFEGVEVCCWFIQYEEFWVFYQCCGEVCFLFLIGGKFFNFVYGQFINFSVFYKFFCLFYGVFFFLYQLGGLYRLEI